MATVSLKIAIANQSTIAMMFSETTKVCDVCQQIKERVAETTASGKSINYSLFKPCDNPTEEIWLEPKKTLEYYHLKSGDILEYRKKPFQLHVRTLDSSFDTCLNVDDTQTVAEIKSKVCSDIELPNPEEFSLTVEQAKRKKRPWKRKKIHTEKQLNWLDPEKSPRELGVREESVLILRKRLFLPDSIMRCNESIQLDLQYEEAKTSILNGTDPVTNYEVIKLAALQLQIQYGNFDETQSQPDYSKLQECLPKAYSKRKGIKHDVFLEYQQLHYYSKLEAKCKYCELYETLRTYGVTYFLVKEKVHNVDKLKLRLLGISCKGIMRMKRKTKEILTMWTFTTAVRRYACTANSFKLSQLVADHGNSVLKLYQEIYGSNSEEYLVQTTEGEAISQLISSYISIRERQSPTASVQVTSQETVSNEDTLEVALSQQLSRSEVINEPTPRYMHFFGTIKHQHCVYGGVLEEMSTAIHCFNSYTEIWHTSETHEYPANLYDGACITVGLYLYLYGGYDGHQCQGSLYKLDFEALKWEKLVTDSDRGADRDSQNHPSSKRGCRMLFYNNKLWLFGGYNSQGRTNEFHSYDLKRNSWASVATQGSRPPPCSNFSFTMIDDRRAILFGGCQEEAYFKHVYQLEFSTILRWSEFDRCEADAMWPAERSHHVDVCLGLGGNNPQLLIISGKNADSTLCDAWLLNISSGQWKEIQNNVQSLTRWGHSAIAVTLNPRITEVVIYGGADSLDGSSVLSKTTLLKLGINDISAAVKMNESITRKHAQALCIGPPGSGITSFLMRLLNSQSNGTVISDTSMFHSVSVLDLHTWKEVEFEKSIAEQIQESVYILQQKKPELNSVVGNSCPLPAIAAQVSNSDSDIDTPIVFEANPNITAPSSAIDSSIHRVITSAVTNNGGYVDKSNFILYLKDVGNTLKCRDMTSFLVCGPSIFFFIFRADVEFSTKFQSRCCETEQAKYSMSIEESLLHFLTSLYSIAKFRKFGIPGPFVFIVATHKDKLGGNADQKISKLNEHLKFLINEGGFRGLVFNVHQSKGKVLFAVDSLSDSDDNFKAIRATIYNLIVSRNEFTTSYPISYLLFCLELQKNQRSIFTLEECKSIAAKYNVVDDRINDLVHFLHTQIGAFYYFDELNVLMKHPEDFFSWVSELLTQSSSHNALSMKEADDLANKGILTLAAYTSIAGTYKGTVTANEVLKVLIKHEIVVKLKSIDEEQYLIPCLLRQVSKSAKDDEKTGIAPLFIKFSCEHCPKSLFAVLIAYLLFPQASERKNSGITLSLKDDQIFRNHVSFTVTSSEHPLHRNKLTLSLDCWHIEARFEEGASDFCKTCPSVCSKIRTVIIESIKLSLSHLQYSRVELLLYVECVRCCQLHQVKEDIEHNVIDCPELRKTISVPSRAAYWWDKTQVDRENPLQARKKTLARLPGLTMEDHFAVTKYLEPMDKDDVIALGGSLGLSYPNLCKMISPVAEKMVADWLNEKDYVTSKGRPSWSNLITALHDIGHSGIAEKIQNEMELPELRANTL